MWPIQAVATNVGVIGRALHQFVGCFRTQARHLVSPGGASELLRKGIAELGRIGRAQESWRIDPAGHQNPVKQAFRCGGHQVQRSRDAAHGLARQRHPRGVTLEGGNVSLNPTQGLLLILDGEVMPFVLRHHAGRPQPTQGAQSVIHGDDHSLRRVGKVSCVVLTTRPDHLSATWDPHDDRPRPGGRRFRHINVQAQAVFTRLRVGTTKGVRCLRTHRTEQRGLPQPRPRSDWLRGCPAQGPHRGFSVRDTAVLGDTAFADADKAANG